MYLPPKIFWNQVWTRTELRKKKLKGGSEYSQINIVQDPKLHFLEFIFRHFWHIFAQTLHTPPPPEVTNVTLIFFEDFPKINTIIIVL